MRNTVVQMGASTNHVPFGINISHVLSRHKVNFVKDERKNKE